MGKAVIYTRVSTKAQEDGYSLDVQERDGRRYCAGRHEVVAVESDTFTGHDSLAERDGMQAALRRIRRGEADTLVIWRVDRAGRFMLDNLLLLRDVSEAGGSFESVTEGRVENTPMGKLILSVHSYAGETEWESIRDRTQAGISERVARGSILPGAVPLWGYCWAGERKETYAIDSVSGPVVSDLFEKADGGWSARRLAVWLNAERVPTPGGAKEWTRQRVLEILKTESYTGHHVARRWSCKKEKVRLEDGRVITKMRKRLNPEPIAQQIPALVSEAVWQRVQESVASRRGEHAATENTTLLRGFVYCGLCEARMGTIKRADRKTRRYRCTRHDQGCPGHAFMLPAPVVDDDIWTKAWSVVQDSERWARVTRSQTETLAERHADALHQAETARKELAETREHAALVYQRMSAEKDERIYARNRADLQSLEDRIVLLEQRLSRDLVVVEGIAVHQDYHARLLEKVGPICDYEELTREDKRRVLRLLQARVTCAPGHWDFAFAAQSEGSSYASGGLVYTWAEWLSA